MSLHGTLETFALPDVLALLAATKKSGELRVVGGSVDGRVWFDGGQVVATDVGSSTAFVDAVFDLLRLTAGKFSFDADRQPASASDPVPIDAILGEAQARLDEWRSIEAVVPSLRHSLRLVSEVRDPHVMVSGDQWRALVAIASSASVADAMERLALGEFGTCRMVKDLVEAGLVAVGEPVAPAAAQKKPAAATVAEAPVAEAPEPVPAETEPEAPAAAPEKAEAATPSKPKITPVTPSPAGSAAMDDDGAPPAKPAKVKAAKSTSAAAAEAAEPAPKSPAPEKPAAAPVEVEAAPETVAAEGPAEAVVASSTGEAEGDEPINRGLLLKFLSSVRT